MHAYRSGGIITGVLETLIVITALAGVAGTGIGCIPEMFAVLNRTVKGEMNVTVEPHLKVFAGLDALEADEKTKMKNNAFATSAEAFAAAISGARNCMPRTAVLK